jgi:hypothetical protein
MRKRRTDLASQLETLRVSIPGMRERRTTYLVEDADASLLIKAKSAIADAEADVISLSEDIALLDQEIAAKVAERAAAADMKLRQQTVAELEAKTKLINETAIEAIEVLTRLADHIGTLTPALIDLRPIHELVQKFATEMPEAAALIGRLTRDHARSVLAGTAPATLKSHAPVVVARAPKPQPVPTVKCFTMGKVRWTGGASFEHQYIDLPERLVARALETNHVIHVTDDRVKQLHRATGQKLAPVLPVNDSFVDLEADNLTPRRGLSAADQLVQRHIRTLVRTA